MHHRKKGICGLLLHVASWLVLSQFYGEIMGKATMWNLAVLSAENQWLLSAINWTLISPSPPPANITEKGGKMLWNTAPDMTWPLQSWAQSNCGLHKARTRLGPSTFHMDGGGTHETPEPSRGAIEVFFSFSSGTWLLWSCSCCHKYLTIYAHSRNQN